MNNRYFEITVHYSELIESKRIDLAKSFHTNPLLLHELSTDKSVLVQREVARNRHTTMETLKIMVKSSDRLVQEYAEENSKSGRRALTLELLQRLYD